MPEGKKKFIEDCAKVIDGRVRALEEELAIEQIRNPKASFLPSDRAAISEAKLLASLIRQLALAPYHSDPYKVATKRRAQFGDIVK